MSIKLWPEIERTGVESLDAFHDFASWEAWIEERCPAVREMSFADQADLYGLMCEMAGEIRKSQTIAGG